MNKPDAGLPDPDFSHQLHGVDLGGDDDGYHLYGHGDPEGDMGKYGRTKHWESNLEARTRRDAFKEGVSDV